MIYVPWPVPVPQTFFSAARLDDWCQTSGHVAFVFCLRFGYVDGCFSVPLVDDRPRPPRCDLLALFTLRYLLAETLDFSLNDISDRFFVQREIGFHARLCPGFSSLFRASWRAVDVLVAMH